MASKITDAGLLDRLALADIKDRPDSVPGPGADAYRGLLK